MPAKIKTATPEVSTKHVTLHNANGDRVQVPIYPGKRRIFNSRSDPAQNVRQAIKFALLYLRQKFIGTIVYVNNVPIFHAKYGTDGSYFHGWKQDPVAYYWKRKAGL